MSVVVVGQLCCGNESSGYWCKEPFEPQGELPDDQGYCKCYCPYGDCNNEQCKPLIGCGYATQECCQGKYCHNSILCCVNGTCQSCPDPPPTTTMWLSLLWGVVL